MERFEHILNTSKRTFILKDKDDGATLTFRQDMSADYYDNLDLEDTDPFVDFTNDLIDELERGILSLHIYGENLLSFDDGNFPHLQGNVELRNCTIDNARIHNSVLSDVKISNAGNVTITYSNINKLTHNFAGDVHICFCIVNETYNSVIEGLPLGKNEWLMGKAVDGTMW